jgi:hypothetical protein
MGVIRKKTATRGGEGGVKYVCDVCSADITSTVCQRFHAYVVTSLMGGKLHLGPHTMSCLQRLRSLRTMLRRWRLVS